MKKNVVVLLGIIYSVCSVMAMAPTDKSSVKPSHISLPSGAGSIEGLGESFEPQLNTGGATYGVSVTLPQGRGGLTPTVRLQYDSNTGNGVGGLGWNMEFMCIKRQTDKGLPKYNDKDNDNDNDKDTFIFQGEELVPLTDGTWRCENERQFYRFRQKDTNGDGDSDYWEVTEPNGTRHILGQHRGKKGLWSVVEHPDKKGKTDFANTYCWMVDETIDLHGNKIQYEYTLGNGVLYPSRISYSELGGAAHEVYFSYADRADVLDDFRPTFSVRLDKLIKRIDVKTNNKLVRGYLFEYEYEDGDLTMDLLAEQANYLDLEVSLLKRVVQIDNSGNEENYLPPLLFFYSGLDLTQASPRKFAAAPELDLAQSDGRVQLVDLDGDGLPDLYSTDKTENLQKACLNQGETMLNGEKMLSFSTIQNAGDRGQLDLGGTETIVYDPKGKGLVDFSNLEVNDKGTLFYTYENKSRLDLVSTNRLGFNENPSSPDPINGVPDYVSYNLPRTRMMDVNFDKKGDFICLEPHGNDMRARSYHKIPRSDSEWEETITFLPNSYPITGTFAKGENESNPNVHLSDMNGDRMMDLIYVSTESTASGQSVRVSYWPLCGVGEFGEEHVMENTDGILDIGRTDLRDLFIEDFTGDGLADLLYIENAGSGSTVVLHVNIGGKRFSKGFRQSGLPAFQPRDSANPTVLRIADMNANGSLDLLYRNTRPNSWDYVELMPKGKPNLLNCIDNSLGKRTTIVYDTAAEDERLARESGHPWTTYAPFALQVVRQIRTSCGLDLNGDGEEDVAVSEFRYRDPYYDGLEREFRGFAFAQRVDYGDDYLFDSSEDNPWLDPVTGLMENMKPSTGWNHAETPTRQVSGPSLVSRYRFLTGAADQRDNDDYEDGRPMRPLIDEYTEIGGREEEVLKGLQVVEEKLDPMVLNFKTETENGEFDAACEAAEQGMTVDKRAKLSPDRFVYTRSYQDWTIRRLYRPTEPLEYLADQNQDGVFEDYRNEPTVMIPAGRFEKKGITVKSGNGRTVSYAFSHSLVTENREANGLLSKTYGYPERAFLQTHKEFDYDDYGNKILEKDYGIEDAAYDDERVTRTTYALGGQALDLWVINKPDTILVTDEKGEFVSKKVHFYDGEPFVGIQGAISDRALLHCTEEYVDAATPIQSSRSQYDSYGNVTEVRDPNGNPRKVQWDSVFKTYPVKETIVIGGGNPDLVTTAEYDYGFGVITRSVDFNGLVTDYIYDSFGRPVKTIMPGDTEKYPTTSYEYQMVDTQRNKALNYDSQGHLSISFVPAGSSSRIVTRQREISGKSGEFITVDYTDGCGKKLAQVEEGETEGHWIVKNASSYNLRQTAQAVWQPYEIIKQGIPQFSDFWISGRPPLKDANGDTVECVQNFYDPQGRDIRSITPPEKWGGERREAYTYILPFETRIFDAEDTLEGSKYKDTPHVQYKDGLGRLIALEEIVKLTDSGESGKVTTWRTEYQYDLNDNVIQITDSQGNVKTMEYDGLKRLLVMNDPDMGIVRNTYDAASNLIESVDAKGQKSVYAYDGANRIKSEDYLDKAGFSPDVEYFYDTPQSNLDLGDGTVGTASYTKGQIAYVRDLSGETHFSYDNRQRIAGEVKRIAAENGSLESYLTRYEYDCIGKVVSITYPDGDQVSQEYNSRNLLTRVHGSILGDLISNISYRPSGQLSAIVYGNRVETAYQYDPRLRLTHLETIDPKGTDLINFEYTFDAVSNIRQITDLRKKLSGVEDGAKRYNTQVFEYDDLYRLTQAVYPSLDGKKSDSVNYRYDRIGNMLSQVSSITDVTNGIPVANLGTMLSGGTRDGSWNRNGRGNQPGPHAVTSVGTRQFTYDGNGNMITADGMTYTWDFKDRLVAVEDDTMRAEYVYDYTDRRIVKRVWQKSEGENAKPAEVYYVNQYFEVREHNTQTKYIWSGMTRVARVSERINEGDQIQRLRLNAGWNLIASQVSGKFPVLDPKQNPDISASFWWSGGTDGNGWSSLTSSKYLNAGATIWVYAKKDISVALKGSVSSAGLPELNGQSQFIANILGVPLSIKDAFPADSWVAQYKDQHWEHHLPSVIPVPDEDRDAVVEPGGSVWVSGGSTEIIPPDIGTQLAYYHQDHLGSSGVTTDAQGNLIEEISYFAFGGVRNQYAPRGVDEPYQFTQKERDKESQLNYFESRYQASGLGRFITVDPLLAYQVNECLQDSQKLNLYAYCQNRPLIYIDPTGHDSDTASSGSSSADSSGNITPRNDVVGNNEQAANNNESENVAHFNLVSNVDYKNENNTEQINAAITLDVVTAADNKWGLNGSVNGNNGNIENYSLGAYYGGKLKNNADISANIEVKRNNGNVNVSAGVNYNQEVQGGKFKGYKLSVGLNGNMNIIGGNVSGGSVSVKANVSGPWPPVKEKTVVQPTVVRPLVNNFNF